MSIPVKSGIKSVCWLLSWTAAMFAAPVSAQKFADCSDRFLYSQGANPGDPSTLYEINRSSNPFVFVPLGTATETYNAIGFHPGDLYLYAIKANSQTLLKIDSTGQIVASTVLADLPSANYLAGDIGPNNSSPSADADFDYYVKVSGATTDLYRIRIDTSNIANSSVTQLTMDRSLGGTFDLAWVGDGVNGALYAFNGAGLHRIKPDLANNTATVTTIPNSNGQLGTTGTIGAMFGTPTALYGNSNDGSGAFRFDLVTGKATKLSSSPGGQTNDGAHCVLQEPVLVADLSITKSDGIDEVVSGQDTTYSISVENKGPISVDGAVVQDSPDSATLDCPLSNTVTCAGSGCPGTPSPIQVQDLIAGLRLGLLADASPGNTVTLSMTCKVK